MNAPLNTAETPTETLLHPSLDELVPSPTQPRIRNGFDDAKKKKAAPKKAEATATKKTLAKNAGDWPFPSPGEGVPANQGAPAAVKPAKKKSTAAQPQGATA